MKLIILLLVSQFIFYKMYIIIQKVKYFFNGNQDNIQGVFKVNRDISTK